MQKKVNVIIFNNTILFIFTGKNIVITRKKKKKKTNKAGEPGGINSRTNSRSRRIHAGCR